MKNVLIIFYSIANPEILIERALELFDPGAGTLYLLFYYEDHVPKTLANMMAYIGFLGEKVRSDMEKSIIDNYQVQVREIINDAIINAGTKEVKIKHYNASDNENLLDYLQLINTDYLLINHTDNDYINQAKVTCDLQELLKTFKGKYELYTDGENNG
jgi:hypothetical protein